MKSRIIKLLLIVFALTLCLGIFSACGDTTKTPNPPTHTHDYKTLKYDETSHWYECECKEKSNLVTHTLVNNACVCGYVKTGEHTHDYKTLKYDETSHWYECECKEKSGNENHKGGIATETAKAKCEVCNQEYGEFAVIEGLVFKKINNNTEYEVSDYNGTSQELCIPSTYNNLPVTSIGDDAFYGCYSLTSITIPDSVTSIGDDAFYNCDSLTSVTIGNSVTSIGYRTFYDCDSLESVVIGDSVTSIGDTAFASCDSLTSITIPDSVTSIGDMAFYWCTSLESILIPNSVISIGDGSFYFCSLLTIYCEAESQPNGWSSDWNMENRPVVWGYKGE